MEATIFDETIHKGQQRIGVRVVDNNSTEHELSIDKYGEIHIHEQDGYPDVPSERSPDGVRNVTQAQQYAKYYAHKECGYPTISLQKDPDRITLVALIVAAMDTETFEEYFGDFYQQFRHHHEDEDPAIEIPDDLYTEDVFYYYTTEIFLGLDETAEADLIEQLQDETVQEYLEEAESITGSGDVAAITDELSALATEHGFGGGELQTLAPEQWIETTSELHVKWEIGDEIYGEFNGKPALDRGPDAELELVPHEPESMEALQEYAVHNLKCQIRDCYVYMGVTPPESVRVTGPGKNLFTGLYQRYDGWQPYYDSDADINWENV